MEKREGDHGMLTVEVWRGREEGFFQSYSVPHQEKQTILDAVSYIQRRLDETVSYRFACRIGMCGSCAMMVNGAPRWVSVTPSKAASFTGCDSATSRPAQSPTMPCTGIATAAKASATTRPVRW